MAGPGPFAPPPPTPRTRSATLTADQRRLVESHQRFAVWIVRTYWPYLRGHDREAAVAASMLGLVQAARRFDPTRAAPFMAYAGAWCRQCVSRERYRDAQRGFRNVRPNAVRVVDLDAAVGEGGGAFGAAFVADDGAPGQPAADARADVPELLAALPDRERALLTAVYLDGIPAATIARKAQISRERIGQLERRALNRLRRKIGLPVQ